MPTNLVTLVLLGGLLSIGVVNSQVFCEYEKYHGNPTEWKDVSGDRFLAVVISSREAPVCSDN